MLVDFLESLNPLSQRLGNAKPSVIQQVLREFVLFLTMMIWSTAVGLISTTCPKAHWLDASV